MDTIGSHVLRLSWARLWCMQSRVVGIVYNALLALRREMLAHSCTDR